jgi:AmiR/NasT family two-component response regulator
MDTQPPTPLRVLVADGQPARLEEITRAVASLGHEVIPRQGDLNGIGSITAAVRPEVAIVIVGDESEQALKLIGKIVHESSCPVIAILDVQDRTFIREAAKRGLFAYITGGDDLEELQSSIDIVLRRFAEYHDLEGAFSRRAVTERAKGILMERHGVDEQEAFSLLREQSRRTNRKIIDVAESVVASHALLPRSDRLSARDADDE